MSNMSFDVDLAVKIGLPEALLLQNINFWVRKNEVDTRNIHEGCAWTYNSIKVFHKLFPFLTENIIRCKLNWLEANGYIKIGNFNKTAYDRTKWYSITEKGNQLLNKQEHLIATAETPKESEAIPFVNEANGKMADANESVAINEPIPDIKPDIYTDINKDITTDSKPYTNAGARGCG